MLNGEPQLVLDPSSAWEVVYNNTRDACPDKVPPGPADFSRDGTDSMPAAYFSTQSNLTFMWAAVSGGVRPNVGKGPHGLDEMTHDCGRLLFNSSFLPTPESFANFQWLQSAHLFDNGTGFALVHNEFHGWAVPDAPSFCSYNHTVPPPPPLRLTGVCNVWSTGVARTSDGGRSWHLAAPPPSHRAFSTPYEYKQDDRTYGFGAISSTLAGDDGAYYGLVHVLANARHPDGQPTANCAFRSASPLDPSSYRLWNGSAFAVEALNPYAKPMPAGSKAGLCAGVTNFSGTDGGSDLVSHPSPRRMVGFGEGWPSFILFGDESAAAPGAVSYRFSHKRDFASAVTTWTHPPQTLDLGLSRDLPRGGRVLYPTLLDARSPELGCNSFTHVGNESAYIYVNIQRILLRRRVLFRAPPVRPRPPPPSPHPPPPPPAAPASCVRFCVRGAGRGDADGIYVAAPQRTSDARPVFEKDDRHQLYRFGDTGRLRTLRSPRARCIRNRPPCRTAQCHRRAIGALCALHMRLRPCQCCAADRIHET